MSPKNNLLSHKIIYLLVRFFRGLSILLLTLFFVYYLPSFHPSSSRWDNEGGGALASPYLCWDFVTSQSSKGLITSQTSWCASLVVLIQQCGGFPLDDELVVPFKSSPTPTPCAFVVTYANLAFGLGLLPFVLAKSTFGS
jgi:hypothetical protein